MPDPADEFYIVATTADLSEGEQMHVELHGKDILLCRHQGNYYAIGLYCSHEEFALEGGDMTNECITCPYHGAEFDLRNGAVLAPPAVERINAYPVRITNGKIAIRPAPDEAN